MDLIAEHLFTKPKGQALTAREIATQTAEINAIAQRADAARAMIPQALAMVRAAPKDHRPQLLAATLMERARLKENMLDTWSGLHDRFPHLHIALRYMVRWLGRDGQDAEATELLCAMIEMAEDGRRTLEFAELCAEIKHTEHAIVLFEQLLKADPQNVSLRVIYGKTMLARGEIYRAFDILGPIREERLSATARAVVDRGAEAHAAMEGLGGGEASVLTRAIEAFAGRETRALEPGAFRGISFYTGSLGAGGAERQLTQIASALHHRARVGRNVHGTRLSGTIEVIVNNIDAEKGKNFFEPALKASGVALRVTAEMPQQKLEEISVEHPGLSTLLPHLPRNMRYGLERLTAHFRAMRPDVAYFWQDGAVLTGALAALVAGVPRIAISLRGLPPNMRPVLMKPEYPDLYRALAKVPGVSFSCNSRTAADAYAAWLDLPAERFNVIYNAVQPLADDAQSADLRRWSLFDMATADAEFTLGGIFRFTPNKRGITWIEHAHDLWKARPNTRFVLVGDGQEAQAAQARAEALGFANRVLFVGNSKVPGFWLSKMDGLCLLSENEGLPNVLIEAQIAGKPVISTPAGGAAETFEDTSSGFLLSSAEAPSSHEFKVFCGLLMSDPARAAEMGARGQALARAKFDREGILAQTMRLFAGERVAGDRETHADSKITQLSPKTVQSAFDPRVKAAYKVGAEL